MEVLEYATDKGFNPFRTWLEGIKDKRTRAVIDSRLLRIARGLMGDCKSVGFGVFEFRIDFGPGYRVYFAFEGDRVLVLLAGGDKKTQPMDIKRAQKYWEDYKK